MSLGYILARSADTIADTDLVPREQRIGLLRLFQQQLNAASISSQSLQEIRRALPWSQTPQAEQTLLNRLPEAFDALVRTPKDDLARLRTVLNGLSEGMIQTLTNFPGHSSAEMRAFQTFEELDAYTYYAAGIVGEFWTDVSWAHLPSLRHWDLPAMKAAGMRFGKGLQMVNVLKDASRDLRNGRCYFPVTLLRQASLDPQALLEPSNLDTFRPVLFHLTRLTLEHFEVAQNYVLAIPRREIRLRLACIWPLWIGLRTLKLLLNSDRLLDPSITLKISRAEVYRLIRLSFACVYSNALTKGYTSRFQAEVETALGESVH